MILFSIIFCITLFAELIANDRPILIKYKGEYFTPIIKFYPETTFGGDLKTEAVYRDIEVKCLILSAVNVLDYIVQIFPVLFDGKINGKNIDQGWIITPLIPYSYKTINDIEGTAPSAPDRLHFLGTDNSARDVLARVIYGFRLSIVFTLIVTFISSIIGVIAGAIQGYFGGRTDLIMQRVLEVWGATPQLYIIIIMFAILGRSFWLLVFLTILFGWTALVGVVRAEFLRARNFEYVRAAKALGVSNRVIMFRHMLPNAMVATITILPFIITGTIGLLASLDFLGFGAAFLVLVW